jgi:hypothetical protein
VTKIVAGDTSEVVLTVKEESHHMTFLGFDVKLTFQRKR